MSSTLSKKSRSHLPVAACLLTLCCLGLVGRRAVASDWPGFRGRDVTGISSEASIFPADGKFSLDVAWKRDLGSGYAGVAIAEGTIVTAFSDGTSDIAIALDEKTGDERWRFTLDDTYVGHDGSHTGPISTPVISEGRVFVLSPRGKLFGLDLKSGKRLWFEDLTKRHGSSKPHYGFATSPIVHDGVLVVQIGGKGGAIAGFDPKKGKRRWRLGKDEIQYQSPIRTTLFGREQIIAAGDSKLFGLDAKKGKALWEYSHGGGGARGVASLVPVPAGEATFFLAYQDDSSTVVRLQEVDGNVKGKQRWGNRNIRNSYNVPVFHDGYLYAYSSRFLTCVDAATGKSRWRSRDPGDGFTILVDGHLVIATKKGGIHVAKATPQGYDELASVQPFDEMAWSPPAFANGHIVMRGLNEIARVAVRSGTATATDESEDVVVSSSFAKFLDEVVQAQDKRKVVDQFIRKNKPLPFTDEGIVHFVYRGKGTDLAVGSDLFGARQERMMKRVEGTDLFFCTAKLDPDTRANYLFIRDYEDHLTDPNNSRKTKTSIFGKEMEMSFSGGTMDMSWFAMPQWSAPRYFETPKRGQKGRIEKKSVKSKLIKRPIPVEVYLPVGYAKSDQRFPVVYVHGGKAAIKRGEMPKALDNLIGTQVDPIIAVFIMYDVPMFGPSKYVEMFTDELVDFIDENYRTIASPKGRASIGVGFVGATAVSTVLEKPNLIGKIGCQSPFIFGSTMDGIKSQVEAFKGSPIDVYVDWGTYDFRNPDEAWDMGATAIEFGELMRKNGHTVSGGEAHDGTGWSSWRNRFDLLFASLFPKK